MALGFVFIFGQVIMLWLFDSVMFHYADREVILII